MIITIMLKESIVLEKNSIKIYPGYIGLLFIFGNDANVVLTVSLNRFHKMFCLRC